MPKRPRLWIVHFQIVMVIIPSISFNSNHGARSTSLQLFGDGFEPFDDRVAVRGVQGLEQRVESFAIREVRGVPDEVESAVEGPAGGEVLGLLADELAGGAEVLDGGGDVALGEEGGGCEGSEDGWVLGGRVGLGKAIGEIAAGFQAVFVALGGEEKLGEVDLGEEIVGMAADLSRRTLF